MSEPVDVIGTGPDANGPPRVVHAAGALIWRVRKEILQVLLVHRPRYDDWSWPKGKVDAGETLAACAVREVSEETGLDVVLGRPLPTSRYRLSDGDGLSAGDDRTGRVKQVAYWAAQAPDSQHRDDGATMRPPRPHEVDRVLWLNSTSARERLTRPQDVAQLDALVAWSEAGTLRTWPLIVIRHGQPYPREEWALADGDRPLVAAGNRQALALVPLLAAWCPLHLVTSPWLRCTATISPYAASAGARVRAKGRLSEDGYRRSPQKSARTVARLLEQGRAVALCTHRPVLPTVLGALVDRVHPDDPQADEVMAVLRSAATDDRESPTLMAMGEVVVVHLADVRGQPRVVAAERHLPDSRLLDLGY